MLATLTSTGSSKYSQVKYVQHQGSPNSSLALFKLCKVFFFKLLPNVFLEREHYVTEHLPVSSSPWESEPSLRKALRNTSEIPAGSFLPVPTVSRALILSFLQLTQQLMHPTRERKGYLSAHLIMNRYVNSLPQRTSKRQVSTGGLSMWVFLQVSAQRWAARPGSRGLPGSLLSGPQNSVAAGIQGGNRKQRAPR